MENLQEVLTVAQRLKRRNLMKKMKARIKLARKRALKRRASVDKLKKRARRSAINAIKKKFAGGKSLSKLSVGDKARLERIVDRKKKAVDRLSKRMLKVVRKRDRDRLLRKEEVEKIIDSMIDGASLEIIAEVHQVDLNELERVKDMILEEVGEIEDEQIIDDLIQIMVLEEILEEKELGEDEYA